MSKLVKVKAIHNFSDSKEEVYRVAGDEFECTEERADQLVNFINGEQPYPLVEILKAGAANNKNKEEADKPKETDNKEDKEEAEAPKAKGNKRNTKANKAE